MFYYNVNKRFLIFVFLFVFLFLFSAFRDSLGTDYSFYEFNYEHPKSMFKIEFLFELLFVQFLRIFSFDAILFFIVTSFLINFLIIKKIYYDNYLPYVSLIIYVSYFYLSSFNVIRQFIVIAFFYAYLVDLLEHNDKKFLIWGLLLTFIHLSFLAIIPLYFFNNRVIKRNFLLSIWGGSVLILLLQVYKFYSIVDLAEYIRNFSWISVKFELWANAIKALYRDVQSNIQLYLKNLLFLILFFRLTKKNIHESYIYLILFLFGLIFQNLFSSIEFIGVRIGYYGDFALIFLVPMYIKSLNVKINRQIAAVCFLLYFVGLGFYRFYINGESQALPKWKPNKELLLKQRSILEKRDSS